MKIEKRELQSAKNHCYTIYDMTAGQGLSVSVMTLGAGIEQVALSENGKTCPLALGFMDIAHYESCTGYAGATLGANAGRIRNGELPVGQRQYAHKK